MQIEWGTVWLIKQITWVTGVQIVWHTVWLGMQIMPLEQYFNNTDNVVS